MPSCCLSYLFYCSLSGIFVFTILGIFTFTNNSFLLMHNMKNSDSIFHEDKKKNAYLQYFIAALFESLFALIIYISNIFFCGKKKRFKDIIKNINEIEIINSVTSHDNNNINNNIFNNNQNDNIGNLNNEINTNKGMMEKDD